MNSINKKDSEGKEIFEGDTIQLTDAKAYFEEDFLSFLNIDKITVYVVPMNGQVGVDLEYHFFSNDVETLITYAQHRDYALSKAETSEDTDEINKSFESLGERKGDVLKTVLSSKNKPIDFAHQFVHKKKTIIKETVVGDERDVSKNEDRVIVYDNDKKAPIDQSFIVVLSEAGKKRALEVHESLYENDNGYKGDFNQIKLVPNIKRDGEHEFKAIPLNEHFLNEFYSIEESTEKRMDERREVLRPIRHEIEKWKEDNKDLDSTQFEKIHTQKLERYKKALSELNEKKYFQDVKVNEMFLGFAVSDNLLDYFISSGSTVEPINEVDHPHFFEST